MPLGALSLETLRSGGKRALANALAALEARPGDGDVLALLDEACAEPRAHVIGLTGPPGVGKSTLLNTLIEAWRGDGRTVGVIAVDPSSQRSGGALLGDRTRLQTDPDDRGVFVRSMAARGRLGGVADLTLPAIVVLRALFDVVVVETVGVGQSETEISGLADTTVFCVQPSSGDSLQFMKAGIMETPDLVVINKADLGAAADRAAADVASAMRVLGDMQDAWTVPVLKTAAARRDGLPELIAALDGHLAHLRERGDFDNRRRRQLEAWLHREIAARFGTFGLSRLDEAAFRLDDDAAPFARLGTLEQRLLAGAPGARSD